jgi:hypothetical protein
MGALIDKIAASAGMASYMRPDSPDGPYEGRKAAHALAWELAEDIRDLGLKIDVAWETNWIRLSWPGGSHFGFVAEGADEFKIDGRRPTRAIGRDALMSEIARWIETVQRELH